MTFQENTKDELKKIIFVEYSVTNVDGTDIDSDGRAV
jgi:hypothetical protein